jgi:acyl carrier protein
MAKPATPASVIREVLARTCGRPVRDKEKLATDLDLDPAERAELLVALELALRCEARDIQLTGDVTVADLIAILKKRAAA